MTPEEIDQITDDEFQRHLLFCIYVLGEPLTVALTMADAAIEDGYPLTIGAMYHIAENWESGYKAPNRKGVRHENHCLNDEPGVTICTCAPLVEE